MKKLSGVIPPPLLEQDGLYLPLLVIVPVGQLVVYVQTPGDVTCNEQVAPPVGAQFLHHLAVYDLLPLSVELIVFVKLVPAASFHPLNV